MRKMILILLLVLVGCGQNNEQTAAQPTAAVPTTGATAVPTAASATAPATIVALTPAPSATAPPTATPIATATPTAASAPTSAPTADPNLGKPDVTSNPLVELARNDLASYLGIAASQITTTSVEQTEWRDGSLGCPKPGMMYPQVLTSGYNITLAAQGKQYSYHTNMRTQVVRCDKP